MPVGIGEMRLAKPLAAVLAILQALVVAGLIHARNRLAELFFGFCRCRFHGILRIAGGGVSGKGTQ